MGVKSGISRKRGGLAKRLDGWQPGLLAVLLAWSMALLVVPRPAPPVDVPEPLVPPIAVTALRAREGALVQAAQRSLPPGARALGSAVRAFGRAEARRDGPAVAVARQSIATAVSALPREGLGDVLALRAYQAQAFTEAVRTWEKTGVEPDDAIELGGGLFDVVKDHCREGGRVTMDDDLIGAVFRKRWKSVVGAGEGDLAPSLLEERMLFVFALRHARRPESGDSRAASASAAAALVRRIDVFAPMDPEYPADFARGVVYYRAGQFARSAQAFQRHLERQPDGPLAARAHNHARAAMGAELGEGDPGWLPL